MRVFKFGGASVKDANAVRNVAEIIRSFQGEKLGVVVSAMGKTTNALESIVDSIWSQDKKQFEEQLENLEQFHDSILQDLFIEDISNVSADCQKVYQELIKRFQEALPDNYDFEYDQIVSLGEVLSTKIINHYLQSVGISSTWADARKLIRTNNYYREGGVNWDKTKELFTTRFLPMLEVTDVVVTQGFIGHTDEGMTTTLGREGSDYTAGIMAYCCDAQDVTIWKDVPGMLNADPKWFDNTVKLDSISFKEAIELSYYGASVIHPKTIKPLQNKEIPLYVKSFINPKESGTVIQGSTKNDHLVPSFIFKLDQVLFSIMPKDFSFIVEEHLSDIFERLAKAKAKINLMQNSALNFSILLDERKTDIQQLIGLFEDEYSIKYNTGLELVTIRHYDQATINRVTANKEILLQQLTRHTARLIVKQK